MNSPIWVRKNIGDPKREPGIPYQDPGSFDKWLLSTLGGKKDVKRVILFGLTLDACILCTAQELTFRGYEVEVIYEGTDTRSGRKKEKEYQLSNPPVTFWLKRLDWSDLLGRMKE
jgi:nicotinamidase-related amidase